MRLSTSINTQFDPDFYRSVEEQIQEVYDAGFRVMDMNFWDWFHDERSPLRQPDWENWVQGIKEKARRLGIEFSQSHAYVYSFYEYPDNELYYSHYVKSIKGSAALGIPWVTFHPSYSEEMVAEKGMKRVLDENVEFYKPLAAMAGELGTGIALENMPKIVTSAEEIIYMVDALSAYGPMGICWDTGHANVAGEPQAMSIRAMGSRLHSLHVQDNDGIKDQHFPPFFGNIHWQELLAALREIDYPGDFTFETHTVGKNVPEAARPDTMRALYSIGRAMLAGEK